MRGRQKSQPVSVVSKIAVRPHSKSSGAQRSGPLKAIDCNGAQGPGVQREMCSTENRAEMVQELTMRKDLLEKALADALDENRKLLKEAKRLQAIEKQYDKEVSLSKMLTIITEAAKEPSEVPGSTT